MEAVPRLPLIGFKLTQSAEPPTSFNNLKLYIAEQYQEDAPDSYSKEVHELETLRNRACRPSHDMDGCLTLKRYYCQLNSLLHRFPLLAERPLLTFAWRDNASNSVVSFSDIRSEMAVILYNIAALHSQLGSDEERVTPESLKVACTHFQCAAGALEMFKEHGAPPEMTDMSSDVILMLNRLCLAQAQECILEKSLTDNRKPGIVAKVTAQIVSYYNAALAMIIASGEDGLLSDVVGSKQFKDGKKYINFKISYLSSILYLYQALAAEEAKRFGERVTLCQLACDKLEESQKEASKAIAKAEDVQKALTVAAEILEEKRKAAKNENEFIYHEVVPDISSISAVQGANLVNGIAFSVTDTELLGKDIFHRLVPMRAHEAGSLYSEEKAQLLRSIGTKIEDRDAELNAFMNSLNMEFLQFDQAAATKLPQAIVDRCASLNARPNAIPDLVALMSQLAENTGDVEMLLREIKQIFAEEEVHEKAYQQAMGQRPTVHLSELNREYQKYQEAHNKAGESNETLRKAMGLHVANLRMLSKPMTEIQALVPQLAQVGENPHFAELRMLLNKVTEMRGQRTQFVNGLREAVNSDDITSKIVAWGDSGDMQELFRQEMGKHEKTATLIDMNLVAQGNILKALTDCYAKCASAIKQMSDTKHKRDQFFSGLVASYDVYEDLLGKSTKGLEFYKKLHNNVAKLLTRVKAARDVQSEERQQRLNSTAKVATGGSPATSSSVYVSGGSSGVGLSMDNKSLSTGATPKLRDYMKAGGGFVPAVRPSPLGSENTTASTCVTSTATDKFNSQTMVMAMQYGGNVNVTGAGAVNTNNSYHNPQSQQASYNPVNTTTGTSNESNNYYGTTSGGYGSHQQQQQQQQAYSGVTATGYVNPIYQTGVYGSAEQHAVSSYNYPTMSSSSNSSSTGALSTVNTVAGASQNLNMNQQETSGTGSYMTNTGYNNNSSTQQYPTSLSYSAPTSAYVGGSPASSVVTSGSSDGLQSGYSMGYPQQQQQQSYSEPHSHHSTVATHSVISTASNYPTYGSHSYATTGSTYGTQTQLGQQQQPLGQYSTVVSGHQQQQPSQHPESALNNYSNATSSSSVSTTNMNTTNIPQVAQQMSQMNISTTGGTSSYGNYYGTQSQQYPVTGQQPQTYYGQEGSNLNQYSQPQQQPQQQYGTQSTIDPGQYSTANQYNNQGYGYENQTGSTTTWNQQQNPSSVGGQGTAYATTGAAYPTGNQSYDVNQSNVTTTATQPVSQSNAPAPVNQVPPAAVPPPTTSTPAVTATPAPAPTKPVINSRNMDLLSGIDFAAPASNLPEPVLQPKAATPSASNSVVGEKATEKKQSVVEEKKSLIDEDDVVSVFMGDTQPPPSSLGKMDHIKSFLMSAQQQPQSPSPSLPLDRKMSMDNLSVCSEISSIDQNFDWESVSVRNETIGVGGEQTEAILSKFRADGGADDPKVMKYFHSEVERLEKFLEGVNIKTLNGSTPLDKKWQELQNLLAKEAGKRTTAVAKLFPEKNRSPDCIPYDHARVQLPTATDDYVNASFVRELGSSCPSLILAQTPMQNTNKDFWHMVWSQKSPIVMCLHTPAEMIHPFWPTKVSEEMHFDDFSVVLLKQFDLTNCIEYSLKLTMLGSDVMHELSALQLKTWAQNVPSQVVGVARDVITSYKQRVLSESGSGSIAAAGPIVINCLTGSKRSPLVAVTVVAVLATKSKRPLLINVVDAWFRIATQRRGVLENEKELEYSFQVMLSNAHDLLNKHGIMTPYQVKNAQKAAIIEKEQIKDPLSELDPLWKMKKK